MEYNLSIQILELIALVFGAASVSFTITTTSMFKWLREWLSPVHEKIEELIHCPWCLGHWIVFVVLLVGKNIPILGISDYYTFNWLFTAFATMAPVGLIHYVLLRAYEPVAKAMAQRRIDKLNKEE